MNGKNPKSLLLPMVVIVVGLPGTGKSYFASTLSRLLNAEYINSDRLRKELFQKRSYTEKEKEAVYKAMLERTGKALHENTNIVIDGTFYKDKIRKMFLDEFKDRSGIFFIEIIANENLVHQRLQNKRADSEADFEVYKMIKQQWEPLSEPHLILNSTDDSIDVMIRTAIDYLQTNNDKRSNQ